MPVQPLIVGVGGPSGSGKTSLCCAIRDRVGPQLCGVLEMDRYYHDLSRLSELERRARNFDEPAALEVALLAAHLAELARGGAVRVPVYDFVTHTRSAAGQLFAPRAMVLLEGIFTLACPEVRSALHWSVFVATPDEVCLARRLARDVGARGRTADQVLAQYEAYVRPAAERIVRPSALDACRVVEGTAPLDALCDAVLADLDLLWPRHSRA